jgi:hypothetical protein
MTLVITVNLILSAMVFIAVVGFLARAIRPARRVAMNAPASGRASSSNRHPVIVAAATALGAR